MVTFANIPHYTYLVIAVYNFDTYFMATCTNPELYINAPTEEKALELIRAKLNEILNPTLIENEQEHS